MKFQFLFFLLLVACAFDLRTRRIPNALIAAGFVAALSLGLHEDGASGAAHSLAGMACGLLVLLPFFPLRLVGAGDVKLMSVVGGFVGVHALIPITIHTFIAGGVVATLALVASGSTSRAIDNLRSVMTSIALRVGAGGIALSDCSTTTAYRVPYALAITLGVGTWLIGLE